MDDILLRALVAIPVALLLPLGLPSPLRLWIRALLAFVIALAALAGEVGHWQTWAVVAATTVAAMIPVPDLHRPWGLMAATQASIAVAIFVTDPDVVADRLTALAADGKVVVVAAGGLAAVFLGGAFIGMLLHPFAERVGRPGSDVRGMEHAGRIIGWIERALLYSLVLVGAPGAAALVIAGKSVARFPSFKEERFAEYYLIGSLMSLAIALGAALAVRAIIGLEPIAAP
jgi:hypothetical protein